MILFAFIMPNEFELIRPCKEFEHAKVSLISLQKLGNI